MENSSIEVDDRLLTFYPKVVETRRAPIAINYDKILTDGANRDLIRIRNNTNREHREDINRRMHRGHKNDDRRRVNRNGSEDGFFNKVNEGHII